MRSTLAAGNTSLGVATLRRLTSPPWPLQAKPLLTLSIATKLSSSASQYHSSRSIRATAFPYSCNRKTHSLHPNPVAAQETGAASLQCRLCHMHSCFLSTWSGALTAARSCYPLSIRQSSVHLVSYSGETDRFREHPTRAVSLGQLRSINMSGRQLRVRKETTKTVETVVTVRAMRNGTESAKKSSKARATPEKEVKKLKKDDFVVDDWQYQLLERHEDNNLGSYTVFELRELLREMGVQSKGLKPDLLKAVRRWLSDHGCPPPASKEDTEAGNEAKPVASTGPKGDDNASTAEVAVASIIQESPQGRTKQTVLEPTTPTRGKRQKRAVGGDTQTDEPEKPEKPSPRAKSAKPTTAGKAKDAVLKTGTLTDENAAAWTVLVHRSHRPEWVAYNPTTMRPGPPPAAEKAVKLVSWNVNGLRALLKEKGMQHEQGSLIARLAVREDFDVLCLQETKLQEKDVEQIRESLLASHEESLWSCSTGKLGYSGTAIISRIKPLSVQYGLAIPDHDREGRLITCEFNSFYFVVSYVPNSGANLERLAYRTQEWDPALSNYLKELEKKKPVIFTGDLNCAHEEIDIHHPAGNKRSAGFTDEERESFKTNFLDRGFVDTFRKQHPNAVAYTYWGYRTAARPKNKGWRLDYFLVSESLADSVHDSYTIPDVGGSDHCPIGLILKT